MAFLHSKKQHINSVIDLAKDSSSTYQRTRHQLRLRLLSAVHWRRRIKSLTLNGAQVPQIRSQPEIGCEAEWNALYAEREVYVPSAVHRQTRRSSWSVNCRCHTRTQMLWYSSIAGTVSPPLICPIQLPFGSAKPTVAERMCLRQTEKVCIYVVGVSMSKYISWCIYVVGVCAVF